MCNIMNLLFLCFVFLLRKPAKGWAKLFHANEVRLGGVGGRCRVWCINPSVRWGVGWAFCPLFRAMYHAANGRRWVSIPPWSARLGSGLEGVAQFSTLVLEEYFRELETVRKCQKKKVPNLAKIGFSKLAPAYGCSGNAWSGLWQVLQLQWCCICLFWFALTGCDRKFAAAMRHMVCDRLMCRSRCLSSVVEMGVCFLEVAGLDCFYVPYARVWGTLLSFCLGGQANRKVAIAATCHKPYEALLLQPF